MAGADPKKIFDFTPEGAAGQDTLWALEEAVHDCIAAMLQAKADRDALIHGVGRVSKPSLRDDEDGVRYQLQIRTCNSRINANAARGVERALSLFHSRATDRIRGRSYPTAEGEALETIRRDRRDRHREATAKHTG